MNTTEQILLIILSTFLTLFIILSVVLLIKLLKLTKKMNSIADMAQEIVSKAHDIADNVENVSDMFKKTAGPLALGRYFLNIAEAVSKHKRGSK